MPGWAVIVATCFLSTVIGTMIARFFMGGESSIGDKGFGTEIVYAVVIAVAKMVCFFAVVHITHNHNFHSMRAVYVVCGLATAFLQKLLHLEMTPGEVAIVTVADMAVLFLLVWTFVKFLM